MIRGVTDNDEGVYTCRVRVLDLGTVEEKFINLEVQEAPKIVTHPLKLEGVEEESVNLECHATGKPLPIYSWTNERGQDLSELERFVVDK